jgi:hypothetical protein
MCNCIISMGVYVDLRTTLIKKEHNHLNKNPILVIESDSYN